MPFRITANLKDGQALTAQFDDRGTAEAEHRWIERMRSRVFWPAVSWKTVTGERWVFAPSEIVGELKIQEVQPLEAAAS